VKSVGLIAWKEFSDRFRSGWVIACAAVWLGAIALTSLFGLVQIGKIGLQGYEHTVVSLLNLVQYLVPLLALLLGKFLGGCLALTFPLVLGFTIAGVMIGLSAGRHGLATFFTLAISGLVLGIIFLALGLLISILCRTRVQALVVALLTWCVAIFVFDLVALGLVVSTRTNQAAQQIETATGATHVTSIADMHAGFENGIDQTPRPSEKTSQALFLSLLINPVDLFRAVNLPGAAQPVPLYAGIFTVAFWISLSLGAGLWRLRRSDL